MPDGQHDPDADDDALMAAWITGDPAAFETLFGRHRQPLFTYLLHHSGARDVAEDVFQETFMRVLRSRDDYAPAGRFVAWLYVIARNALRDHQRRASVRRVVTSESGLLTDDRNADAEPLDQLGTADDRHGDPVVQTETHALRERIEAALLALPEDQRDVFILRERAGLDYAAIAQVMDCPVGTAKSRMRYALSGLRRLLAGELADTSGSAR